MTLKLKLVFVSALAKILRTSAVALLSLIILQSVALSEHANRSFKLDRAKLNATDDSFAWVAGPLGRRTYKACEDAISQANIVLKKNPDDVKARLRKGSALLNKSRLLKGHCDYKLARASCDEAICLCTLPSRKDLDTRLQNKLAEGYWQLGMLCSAQGERANTKQAFRKMLSTCDDLLKRDPANVDAIWMRGESLHHLAYWESVDPETLKYVDTSSQFDQSLEQFDKALPLSRLKPEIVYGQISALSSYALMLEQVGKRDAAQKQLTRAIALSRQVTNCEPSTLLAIRIYEVNDLVEQSDNFSKTGDQVAAISSLTAASNVLEEVKALPNATLDVLQAEVTLLNMRGEVLRASGKPDESLQCYEKARLKCDEFLALRKTDQFIYWSKATAYHSAAKVLKSKGDKQECLKAVDSALAVCEEGLKHNPESAALTTTRDGLTNERERMDN